MIARGQKPPPGPQADCHHQHRRNKGEQRPALM
jgi:hypothetical protein